MDIVLAIVPWKIIWILTMNRKEKVGVMVAMSMGVLYAAPVFPPPSELQLITRNIPLTTYPLYSAGITSMVKVTQLPSISNSTFTESTTQLVILAAAESAITIIAASIPILRALIRDSRPPPGPAEFYHSMDFSMYTGTANSRGTGRSSTVITSGGGGGGSRQGRRHYRGASSHSYSHSQNHSLSQSSRSRSRSRSTTSSAAAWSNKETAGSHSYQTHTRAGSSVGRLSRLSRFSGLSMIVLGGAGDRYGGHAASSSVADGTDRINVAAERSRSVSVQAQVGCDGSCARGSLSLDLAQLTPPPGKIVQTEEVMVRYEERRYSGQWEGQGQEQEQWPGIGTAV